MKGLVVFAILISAVLLFPIVKADAISPGNFGLNEGDLVSANGDPDIYIVNQYGYKRLFLNPAIFNFYGHLGGFSNVKEVDSFSRDSFVTTTYFQNCEIADPKVYAVEITGEDTATLHWLNVPGNEAVASDPDFFKKVFCINNNEFKWYTLGSLYTALSQAPEYRREGAASVILPFEIADVYNPATTSQGELSFAGSWVIIPFGGTLTAGANPWNPGNNPDIVFEVVRGTILKASISGYVTVAKNPVYDNGIDPQDWEIHIKISNDPNSPLVEYDHVIDVLVENGQYVTAGQPLAKAAPAYLRHGGPEGQKPVDEFEWGVRAPNVCPLRYLSDQNREKLKKILQTMSSLGFNSGETICLTEEELG